MLLLVAGLLFIDLKGGQMNQNPGSLLLKAVVPIFILLCAFLLMGEPVQATPANPDTMPDLIITDLYPDATFSDICFQVQNIGLVQSPAGHETQIMVDDQLTFNATVDQTLDPNERYSGCFKASWACSDPVEYLIAWADATDIVDELNEDNNSRTETWNCDQAPPVIIGTPQVINLTEYSATITWDTDEDSNSMVYYDSTLNAFGLAVGDGTLTTTHSLDLAFLTPGTIYQFKVSAGDAVYNTTYSDPLFFETKGLPDSTPPTVADINTVRANAEAVWYALHQPVSEDTSVERVEFYLDGARFSTDYSAEDSPSGYYTADLAPGLLGIDHNSFYIPHTITSKAYNFAGLVDVRNFNFIPLPEPMNGALNILTPAPETVLYIPGKNAPPGTIVHITAHAEEFEDDCSLVPSLHPFNPESMLNKPVECTGQSHAVQHVVFSVGPLNGSYTQLCDVPPADDSTLIYSCDWNASGLVEGQYNIRVQSYSSDGSSLMDVRLYEIIQGASRLTLERSLASHGTTFILTYNIQNLGTFTAELLRINDSVDGFIPLRKTISGGYPVNNTYSYNTQDSGFTINVTAAGGAGLSLPPGSSLVLGIELVPILYPELELSKYKISQNPVTFIYKEGSIQKTQNFNMPVVTTSEGVLLGNAVMAARRTSDYLIVTDPYSLALDGLSSRSFDSLLCTSAELAALKNGILGFLPDIGRNSSQVRAAIRRWGSGMEGSDGIFGHYLSNGYLLIVGETHIVGSWTLETFGIETLWFVDPVHESDNPYADTNDDGTRPDLMVGRIIGDSASVMQVPIQASIDVAKGLPNAVFDRSNALLIAGSGTGVDMFDASLDQVQGIMQHFGVSTLAYKHSSYGSTMITHLLAHEDNQDFIYYRDHCNFNIWSGAFDTTNFSGDNPVNFGNTRPLVFASCCLAGQYINSTGSGGITIAEAFLQTKAPVYIGSTELSDRDINNATSPVFYNNLMANPSTSSGRALWNTKWSLELGYHGRLWTLEYNLYGDPKFGNTAPLPNPGSSSQAEFSTINPGSPNATEDVIIPDLITTTVGSAVEASVSGGGMLDVPGYPRLPSFQSRYLLPPGTTVTGVSLTQKQNITQYPNLVLTINDPAPDNIKSNTRMQITPVIVETWPELEYKWKVERMPDGTRYLIITTYPLRYYPLQALGEFSQLFTYDITLSTTNLSFVMVAPSTPTVDVDAPVLINMWLNNPGTPVNAMLGTSIYRMDGQLVAGLPMHSMDNVQGLTTLSQLWWTTGIEPGMYRITAEIHDKTGALVDTMHSAVTIGAPSGNVGNLLVTPEFFDPGDLVDISFDFTNTGPTVITGTAYAIVQSPTITNTVIFTDLIFGLNPGNNQSFQFSWDTQDASEAEYQVLIYVMFNSTSTDPLVANVAPYKHIYLPLVRRQ